METLPHRTSSSHEVCDISISLLTVYHNSTKPRLSLNNVARGLHGSFYVYLDLSVNFYNQQLFLHSSNPHPGCQCGPFKAHWTQASPATLEIFKKTVVFTQSL
jgi:hypothetical protein